MFRKDEFRLEEEHRKAAEMIGRMGTLSPVTDY